MSTHSPAAQAEVEAKMRNIEAEIVDLKEMIKGYENDFKQATREDRNILGPMIIAKEGRLHDLSEELKALRNQQQQGNEQRTRPFILWFFQNPSSPVMPCCVSTFVFMFSNVEHVVLVVCITLKIIYLLLVGLLIDSVEALANYVERKNWTLDQTSRTPFDVRGYVTQFICPSSSFASAGRFWRYGWPE
jgi:hypothetical protein